MSKQLSMFADGAADLPLFSNTAQRAEQSAFKPVAVPKQPALPYTCKTCRDTGRVDSKFCWCEAGGQARAKAVREGREPMPPCPIKRLTRDGFHWGVLSSGVGPSYLVYREAPSYPGRYGQKVIMWDGTGGRWYLDSPSILVDKLPANAQKLEILFSQEHKPC